MSGETSATYNSAHLERVFNSCFGERERTELLGGAQEPSYQPAQSDTGRAQIVYREDYFASALHEVSHWCIAGALRRQQYDFGYWYAPEGRTDVQQRAFETVEVKPQTLEWFFSKACGYRFQVSVDNFDPVAGELPDTSDFCAKLVSQAKYWQDNGLPKRAACYYEALCAEFNTGIAAQRLVFTLQEIQ